MLSGLTTTSFTTKNLLMWSCWLGMLTRSEVTAGTSSMMVSANTVIGIGERMHPQCINPRLAELHLNRGLNRLCTKYQEWTCPCLHNLWQENCKQRWHGETRDMEDIYYSKYKHRCELCIKCFSSKDILHQHTFDSLLQSNHNIICPNCQWSLFEPYEEWQCLHKSQHFEPWLYNICWSMTTFQLKHSPQTSQICCCLLSWMFQCASPDQLCSQFSCHKLCRQRHGDS